MPPMPTDPPRPLDAAAIAELRQAIKRSDRTTNDDSPVLKWRTEDLLYRHRHALLAAAEMQAEIGWALPSLRAYLYQYMQLGRSNPHATQSAIEIADNWLARTDAILAKFFPHPDATEPPRE